MKHFPFLPLCSVIAASALAVKAQETKIDAAAPDTPPAEDAKADSVLTSTGIAFSVGEAELLVTPENVKIPLNFVRTTVTPLVDESGKTVPWDQIHTGLPLTVQYTMLGDKMVATKVTVTRKMLDGGRDTQPVGEDAQKRADLAEVKMRKDAQTAEKAKTLPASGGGMIMGFEQVIALGDGNGGDVTQYVVNNSTQYLDSAGKPIALNLVRMGARVDVRFVEDAGRKIATQLIIQQRAPGQVVGTAAGVGSSNNQPRNTQPTTNSGQPNTTAGTGTGTVWLDQNGNIIPGTLETGFITPPATVLPGANGTTPGQTGTATGTTGTGATGTAAGTNPSEVNPTPPGTPQPGTAQPGTAQPGTPPAGTQPSTTPPGTTQPGTTQPGTQPGSTRPGTTKPGTTQPGTRPSSTPRPATTPSTPAPATGPAPGGR